MYKNKMILLTNVRGENGLFSKKKIFIGLPNVYPT